MAKIMKRMTKNTCRRCRTRMGQVRCAGCKLYCQDCLLDHGKCFDCVRQLFAMSYHFRVKSTGAVLPFANLKVASPATTGPFVKEKVQVTTTADRSRRTYQECVYPYLDVEPVPPPSLPSLPSWVYADGSVDRQSVRLEYQGRVYQVMSQRGFLYAYENGFLEATQGFSALVIAWAPSFEALGEQIDYWTRMQTKFGGDARSICCEQAELIPCVCQLAYRCPVHYPQGVHRGTHD
jgi:hypothetical protein